MKYKKTLCILPGCFFKSKLGGSLMPPSVVQVPELDMCRRGGGGGGPPAPAVGSSSEPTLEQTTRSFALLSGFPLK